MDNKQLREFILQETCGIKILSLQCDGKEDCKKCSFNIILKALEQADKYRWHNLRKDKSDLPKEHEVFIAYDLFGKTVYDVAYYGEPIMPVCEVRGNVFYQADSEYGDVPVDVIAWKYIEKFSEE